MNNFEKYKEELLKGKHAINKKTNEPKYCRTLSCNDCELEASGRDCTSALIEWGLKEAIEIKLTKKQRAFCEMVETGWLAADKDGYLFYYEDKPPIRSESYEGIWATNGRMAKAKPIYLNDMFPKFPFITWENSPVSIETLLNDGSK